MQKPTEYARLYGVPADETRAKYFIPKYRSGYSPTRAPSGKTDKAKKLFEQQMNFQKERLYGFTSAELEEAGCLRDANLPEYELDNPIMTCLQESHWQKPSNISLNTKLYPIENYSGEWVYSNPIIKPHLERILRLTTLLLNKLAQSDWWYGLQTTSRHIPDNRFDSKDLKSRPKEYLQSLYTVIPQKKVAGEGQPDANKLLNGFLEPRLRLGFMHPSINPATGQETQEISHGTTFGAGPNSQNIWCFFCIEDFKPLLMDDLTNAERLSTQFAIAVTIFHEVMHAAYKAQKAVLRAKFGSGGGVKFITETKEPYFRQEQVAELGWSAENFLLGGILCPEQLNGRPHFCNFMSSFPTTSHLPLHGPEYLRLPILAEPELSEYESMYPIPVSFYEKMFDRNYWIGNLEEVNTCVVQENLKSVRVRGGIQFGWVTTSNLKGCDPETVRTIIYCALEERHTEKLGLFSKQMTELEQGSGGDESKQLEILILMLRELAKILTQMFDALPPRIRPNSQDTRNAFQEMIHVFSQGISNIKDNLERPENTATFDDIQSTVNIVKKGLEGLGFTKAVQIKLPDNSNALDWDHKQPLENAAEAAQSPDYSKQKECFDICNKFLKTDNRSIILRAYAILIISHCGMLLNPNQRLPNLQRGIERLQQGIWKYPPPEMEEREVMLELSSRMDILFMQLKSVCENKIKTTLDTLVSSKNSLDGCKTLLNVRDVEYEEVRIRIYRYSNTNRRWNSNIAIILNELLNSSTTLGEIESEAIYLDDVRPHFKNIAEDRTSSHSIKLVDASTLQILSNSETEPQIQPQTPANLQGQQSYGSQLHSTNSHLYTQTRSSREELAPLQGRGGGGLSRGGNQTRGHTGGQDNRGRGTGHGGGGSGRPTGIGNRTRGYTGGRGNRGRRAGRG